MRVLPTPPTASLTPECLGVPQFSAALISQPGGRPLLQRPTPRPGGPRASDPQATDGRFPGPPPSSGLTHFLERRTELRETFHGLGAGFVIKGCKPATARCNAQRVQRRDRELLCPATAPPLQSVHARQPGSPLNPVFLGFMESPDQGLNSPL